MKRVYANKTGRPSVGLEKKEKFSSVERGELVMLCTRVSPRSYEWLQAESERRCHSMGQVIDEVLFSVNNHKWKAKQ